MDNYITLFQKFIGVIDWKLLPATAVKLNTDYKIRSFYTHHHLATMIYFHVCELDGLRHLNQCTLENLNHIIPKISLGTLSNHNNNRDYKMTGQNLEVLRLVSKCIQVLMVLLVYQIVSFFLMLNVMTALKWMT